MMPVDAFFGIHESPLAVAEMLWYFWEQAEKLSKWRDSPSVALPVGQSQLAIEYYHSKKSLSQMKKGCLACMFPQEKPLGLALGVYPHPAIEEDRGESLFAPVKIPELH